MAALCLTLNCAAQNIAPLQIGDSLPAYTFKKVMNAPFSTMPYPKIKDKVVVLDFFATWCSSCIHLLPHLDSLKAEFGDHLDIFIVTREPGEKVQKLLQTNKKASEIKLPFVVEDSVLYKWFPHRVIPHEVILANGIVKAITYPEFISANTITSVLNKEDVDVPVKSDLAYDLKKSIYENKVGKPIDLSIAKFLMTKHIDGLNSIGSWILSKDSVYKRVTRVNSPLLFYVLWAADMINNGFQNRVILNVKDSSKFLRTTESNYKWERKNTYGIEYIVPAKWSWEQNYAWVLKQLNLCLSYHFYKSTRLVKCWVLKQNKRDDSAYFTPKSNIKHKSYYFNNIIELTHALNSQIIGNPFNPIIIDSTGDSTLGKIEINVANIHDPREVSNALNVYGLCLKPAIEKLEMLIIEDNQM